MKPILRVTKILSVEPDLYSEGINIYLANPDWSGRSMVIMSKDWVRINQVKAGGYWVEHGMHERSYADSIILTSPDRRGEHWEYEGS